MTGQDLLDSFDGYITVAVTGLALVTFVCGFLVGSFGGR